MKIKRNNKGFSLVELIIVIAIMAVLVGVMAPQLIKYIEKSKVSSDLRTLDAIYQAVIYAMNDPNVVQDQASQELINSFGLNPIELSTLGQGDNADTLLYKEIIETLSWQDLDSNEYLKYFTSTHGPDAVIKFQYKGGVMNPIAMWITETDITGKKQIDGQDPASWEDLDNGTCHCIAIK